MDQRPRALISAKAKKFIRPFIEKPKTHKNVLVAKDEKVIWFRVGAHIQI